jgi:hypothetical protein
MKIRNGFVSNSSSSSFICDITGEVESGWDLGLEEAGMYQCENGHTFSEQFLIEEITLEQKRQWLMSSNHGMDYCYKVALRHQKDYDEKYTLERAQELKKEHNRLIGAMSESEVEELYEEAAEEEGRYDIPSILCPICQMKEFTTDHLFKYLRLSRGITKKEIISEVLANFKNFDSFSEFLSGEEES